MGEAEEAQVGHFWCNTAIKRKRFFANPASPAPSLPGEGRQGSEGSVEQGTVSLGGQELRQALFGGGKRGQAAGKV